MERRPEVGIGVIVLNKGKLLLGKRKNSHGDGAWSFPGGHLEFGESWESCALREVYEETNLEIKKIRFATVTNDIFPAEQKHYVTIFVIGDFSFGELKVMEPTKCEQWQWFDWDNLPEPLFIPVQNLRRSNFNPFEG